MRPGSLRTAGLVDAAVKTFGELTLPFDRGWFHRLRAAVGDWFFAGERKSAATINRDFLDWFDRRREPGRPVLRLPQLPRCPYALPAPPGGPAPLRRGPEARATIPGGPDGLEPPRQAEAAPALLEAGRRCLRQLPGLPGRAARRLVRRAGASWRPRSDAGHHHVRPRRGPGRTRPVHAWREPLPHGDPRAPPDPAALAIARPGPWCAETVSLRDLPATIVDLIGLGTGRRSRAGRWPGSWADPRPVPLRSRPRRSLSELDVAQPAEPEPGPLAGLSRPADLAGRGGFRLHPQRGRRGRGTVQRARRPRRAQQSRPRRGHGARSCSGSATSSGGRRARPRPSGMPAPRPASPPRRTPPDPSGPAAPMAGPPQDTR